MPKPRRRSRATTSSTRPTWTRRWRLPLAFRPHGAERWNYGRSSPGRDMVDPVNQLADTVRIEGARILATLVRTVGSLPVAEDAVQDAIVSALREWPRSGIPSEPRAWLTVVARRKAIDALRREASRE